jgi:nucleotide-binding universal stress UspA family protein
MMNINRLANYLSIGNLAPVKVNSNLRLVNGPNPAVLISPVDEVRESGTKIKNILVPLDGSVFAEQAIPLALGIAEQSGAVLNLVHVIVAVEMLDPYDALYFADACLKSLKRDKHRYLNEIVGKITARSKAFITSRVVDGRAVTSALDEVPGLDADLVVMATHGRGTLGRFWSGSVAHSLLQRTAVPVILLRGTNDPVTFNAKPVDHVLLPVDGADTSRKVLDRITDLGIFHAARHSLLHVVPLVPKHVVVEHSLRTEWMPSRRDRIAGMRYLQPLARSLRADGRRVQTKIVSSDEPFWQLVLRCAEQADVDLIALAYRRQWPFARLFCPNTSEYLFRNSPRPIMFVPSEPSS